jgi:hypothetical protein
MDVVNLWKNIGSEISVFTKETAFDIPEGSGIYGWFIPLWIMDDDLSHYISLINKFYLYDPEKCDIPTQKMDCSFNWESIEVALKKGASPKSRPTLTSVNMWNEVMAGNDKKRKDLIAESLMKASLFMPPLYVGKANNLSIRYQQHVNGATENENTFHKRFTNYARAVNLDFTVSDLLFVCIKITDDLSSSIKNKDNELVEQIVMRLCRPTFSLK